METEMKEGGSEWSKPTKTLDAFPLLAEKKPIAGIHALSTETYSDGSSTNYMWDEENHSVYVEGIEANGEADVDDMRDIGKAATRDQAIYAAYNWWRLRK